MKLVTLVLFLSATVLLLYVSSTAKRDSQFGVASTRMLSEPAGPDYVEIPPLFKFLIELQKLLELAFAYIFYPPMRREFLSCQLGFELFCFCGSSDDFRQAIEDNKNINMCFGKSLKFDREIDITNKSFRIGCDLHALDRNNPTRCSLIGSKQHRLLVGSPQDAIFVGIRFQYGRADNGGAMKLTGGATTCTKCGFYSNHVRQNGGAIHISGGGQLTLHKSLEEYNEATMGSGGAMYVTGGATVVISGIPDDPDDPSFRGNFAALKGGAIAIDDGSITLQDSSFGYNGAGTAGADIFIGSGATVTCDNVLFFESAGLAGDQSPTCEASEIGS